jgi:hypothetical protein
MGDVAASNATIMLEDGRGVALFRQRPKVKLNMAGDAPTHLFHGSMRCGERPVTGGIAPLNQCANTSWVSRGNVGINAPPGLDYSFTTVVPLRQGE